MTIRGDLKVYEDVKPGEFLLNRLFCPLTGNYEEVVELCICIGRYDKVYLKKTTLCSGELRDVLVYAYSTVKVIA